MSKPGPLGKAASHAGTPRRGCLFGKLSVYPWIQSAARAVFRIGSNAEVAAVGSHKPKLNLGLLLRGAMHTSAPSGNGIHPQLFDHTAWKYLLQQ